MAPRLRTGLMSQHPDDNYQCHGLQPDDTEKFNVNDTLNTTHVITSHSTNNSIGRTQYDQCRGLTLCCKRYNTLLFCSDIIVVFVVSQLFVRFRCFSPTFCWNNFNPLGLCLLPVFSVFFSIASWPSLLICQFIYTDNVSKNIVLMKYFYYPWNKLIQKKYEELKV